MSEPVNPIAQKRMQVLLACALGGFALCQTGCESDESDGDNEQDAGGIADSGSGPGCEDIEWSPKDYYLAKKSTVARWYQTGYVDTNENGFIDPQEEGDGIIDFIEICRTGKESLVLLMATDD